MLTAYDYPTAKLLDEAGIPLLLVGDSLGRAMLGYENELSVSMEDMLHHAAAVTRGARRALVVGDMPFLSYATPDDALRNAGRFIHDAGVQAVKVEGGVRSARIIETLVKAGIPVMGHIGLTPQSANAIGKFRVQGKSREQARALLHDALAVQEAGAFSVVLELVPEQLAAAITERLRIPTIGIGAGPGCSGQVQIITDLLGVETWQPKHAKPYVNLRETILGRRAGVCRGCRGRHVPGPEQTVRMDDSVLDEVLGRSTLDASAGRPRRRHPGRRDPARSRPLGPRRALKRPPHPRRAARRRSPASQRPLGLVPTMGWLHDGHRSLMQRARDRERDDDRDDLRQPAPVQRGGRLSALPAQRGPRPRDRRGGGHRPRLRPAGRRGLPAGLRHDRLGRRASPVRSRAPLGPATSTASRRSSRSCSTSSAPIAPTSARRTPSRSWSSARWPATWRSRPR